MVYGPIAAFLVELFPTSIRYTSMSLPYHLGNGWFGGFLPLIATAVTTSAWAKTTFGAGAIYTGLDLPDRGLPADARRGRRSSSARRRTTRSTRRSGESSPASRDSMSVHLMAADADAGLLGRSGRGDA